MDKTKIEGWEKEVDKLNLEINKLKVKISGLVGEREKFELKINEETTGFRLGDKIIWKRERLCKPPQNTEGIIERFHEYGWITIRPFKKDGEPAQKTKTIYNLKGVEKAKEK